MKQYRNLIIIVLILAVATWIVLPNNPGIKLSFLEIDRQIKTHLGLDLVGGVQVLLEANPPAGTDVTVEAMNTARQIVENRVNGMGVSEASVQAVGSRRILVELPGIEDSQQAIETVKGTGLLEFIDMSSVSQDQAYTLLGVPVKTSYNQTNITDTLAVKITALKAHTSQMKDWDPTDMVSRWAAEAAHGKEMRYAEGYRVVTLVDDETWQKTIGQPR